MANLDYQNLAVHAYKDRGVRRIMANLDFQNLAVHAYKDLETGLLHVVADIEGALVPLVTHKLGTLAQAQQVAKQQSASQATSTTPTG